MSFHLEVKQSFPIFKNHPNLVYLDSAASTQTPQSVLDAMNQYYTNFRANIHRGVYELSGRATEAFEIARKKVANLINAEADEIVFNSGVTFGLNQLAHTLCKNLVPGDNIVLTRLEHHANLVPWQQMSNKYGFELRFIELTSDYELRATDTPIDDNTKIVSFCHISNAIGTLTPVKKLVELAKSVGAISIVDAAQSIAHKKINVKELDCDFLVFSGHKMYGPTGIGVLYGKKERLENLEPFIFGGDMIKEVSYEKATWADSPSRFEAGTPNIAGAIGLGPAVDFIEKLGYDAISKHELEIVNYTIKKLNELSDVSIVGSPKPGAPISFLVDGVHPHDVATILDSHSVAVRAGHHCAMPLMKHLGITGTTRASFGVYNTKADVDRLVEGVKNALNRFAQT
jgi:cysteine desulfurase / selenocysteine lyase